MSFLTFNRTRRFAAFALCLCVLLLGFHPINASGAKHVSDDFSIKVWDNDDNLSGSTVTSIIQTPDGYLWVGTYEGLIRFDGVHSVLFDSLNKPALGHSRIQGLYLDASGTLWINTYRGGLTSYRDGEFRQEWGDQPYSDYHTTMTSSSAKQVTFVTEFGDVLQRALPGTNWTTLTPPANSRPIWQCTDHNGTLWFVTRDGRVLRVVDGKFEELPANSGMDGKKAITIATDPSGNVWAGLDNGIVRWDGSHFVDMTPTNSEPGEKLNPVYLFPTSSGALWVLDGDRLREEIGRGWVNEAKEWRGLLGSASNRAMGMHEDQSGGIWFNHYGNGVFYISPDGRFSRFTVGDGLPGNRVGAWYQDRDGGVWLGVDRGGLARLSQRRFQAIDSKEGLLPYPALSVCENIDGSIWIGTSGGGLNCYKNGRLTRYPVGIAASENLVYSIFPQTNGDLWLSAGDGEDLYQFQDNEVKRSPLGVHGIKSLLVDHDGRLWAGTKNNIGWYTDTARHVFGRNDGVPESPIRALAEGPDGTIWAGSDDGTLYCCGLTNIQAFRPNDELGPRPIWSLYADPDGTIWAGTFRGGLLQFKNGKFTRFSTKQGLPDIITQILEDQKGRIWLGTHEGICFVQQSALELCAQGKVDSVDVVRHLSGLPTLECSDGYQPSCWDAHGERLWFSTAKGVVSIDPTELASSSLAPPVVIEGLVVDGQSEPINNGKAIIPPGHEEYEFNFTALNFEAPGECRFRYRIDGLDKNWEEADTLRVANYSHLPPNHYHFQVIACNSDGVWNRTGASVDFTIQPYFYQTRWFLVLASLLVLGSVAIVARTIATRKYRQALARLAQQHAIERDRSRIAKDIHDDIGAGLTQITLLSELGRRDPEHSGAQLERISDAARDMTRAMDEIVWAIDPQRDTLASLMDYISAYAEDYLRTAGVRCRMDFPAVLPARPIDAELRYNLFLALKETLNNIVKHARATEVRLQLMVNDHSFTLAVQDNGRGFQANGKSTGSAERHHSGLGLSNLKKRMESIGGRCVMQSSPETGTLIEMSVAFNGRTSPVMTIGGNGSNGYNGLKHEVPYADVP
ncbi:MAG TPA: two-component regulator propeller domain-containing protein [Verrucomicrobiae bacterium]|jgi:signal transduction histidine kinase/ligand-binding sensor domain-containing protein